MQNGNGNGKRWLLIAALILGGIWLLNDAYRDGLSDGLVRSGKVTAVTPIHDGPMYYAGGGGFPWGLLIIGGILYFAWRKGVFGGGPGHFGNGQGYGPGRNVQRYDAAGYGPTQNVAGQGYRQPQGQNWGPRGLFEEWHRQSHEAERHQPPAPGAAPAPGSGYPQAGMSHTPPPTAPSPEYWASMDPVANAPAAPPANGERHQPEQPDGPRGATGPAPEQV